MDTTMDDLIVDLVDDTPAPEPVAVKLYYSPANKGFYTSDVHSVIPEDAVEITSDYKQALFDGQTAGQTIMPPDDEHDLPWLMDPPPPTPEEQAAALQKTFTDAIQQRLDDFARSRNYDNALACASYATSTNPRFASEAQYMVEARDATWAIGYLILDTVMHGERDTPTWEEVEAELPVLIWPDEEGGV